MLVTPSRSLRVENPARQRDIHRKVRERAQAERNSHTRFHQSYQSMSGLLAGWLDDWDFGPRSPGSRTGQFRWGPGGPSGRLRLDRPAAECPALMRATLPGQEYGPEARL